MKTIYRLTTLLVAAFLLLVLTCGTADAQDFWEEYKNKDIDVEGVQIREKMNYKQFVAKFGKPDRYEQRELGDENDPCLDECYWKGKDWFSFRENGTFCTFVLEDSTFAALTLWIPGGIRVGDKLSKADNFKYGKPKVAEWLKPRNGFVEYILFYDYLDDLVYLSVKDGIIYCISYSDTI